MSEFKKLEALLSQGKISRRDFLTRASALGATATLAPSMLIGEAQAAPKQGGKFTAGLGHGSTTDSLDPGTYENDFAISASFVRNNYLTEISNTGELIGELAESWEASPDAKTWTFELRKGVEFHNGQSMTAADVVVSFNHHRGKDSTSAAKPIVDPITDLKADGNAVVFTLNRWQRRFSVHGQRLSHPRAAHQGRQIGLAVGDRLGPLHDAVERPGRTHSLQEEPQLLQVGSRSFRRDRDDHHR